MMNSADLVKQSLVRRYSSLGNKEGDHFYDALTDFVEYINNEDTTKILISKISNSIKLEDQKEKSGLWYAWKKLMLLYLASRKEDELLKKYKFQNRGVLDNKAPFKQSVLSSYQKKDFEAYCDRIYNYLLDGLENNVATQSIEPLLIPEKAPLISTPVETKWSDVTIRWLNGNDVEITLKNDLNYKKVWDFKELGFYDEKRKCPNILWKILLNASRYGREMSWAKLGGASESERHKKIDNFQKQISLLRNKLKDIFGSLKGNRDEPIISHSRDKEYTITLNLITEKGSKKKEDEDWRNMYSEKELSNFDQMEKKDFIKNQSPSSEDDH